MKWWCAMMKFLVTKWNSEIEDEEYSRERVVEEFVREREYNFCYEIPWCSTMIAVPLYIGFHSLILLEYNTNVA